MQWKAEMTSSAGPFAVAHYDAYWEHPGGGQHTFGRNGAGTADWVDTFPIYTGYGYIDGVITSAWDTPIFGILCTSASSVDNSTVVS